MPCARTGTYNILLLFQAIPVYPIGFGQGGENNDLIYSATINQKALQKWVRKQTSPSLWTVDWIYT